MSSAQGAKNLSAIVSIFVLIDDLTIVLAMAPAFMKAGQSRENDRAALISSRMSFAGRDESYACRSRSDT